MAISDKQKKILAFSYTKKYQALICDGAVRSGKTSIMTVAFVDWAMREFNNTNFAICGKTVGSAIKNIIRPFMSLTWSKDKYQMKFVRAPDNMLTIKQGNKTNIFYIYGGRDESSFELIQGLTAAGVLFDEVALQPRSFVEEAIARCLTFSNRKYWFNCNPDSPMHWFYKEWILNLEKHKAYRLQFLMSDNPVLSKEDLEQAENDFSGVFYNRKVLGQWVIADGLIYPNFDKNKHIDYEKNRQYTKYYISNDYGTQHPCVFLLWGLATDGVWYCVKEYYHKGSDGRQKTVDEYYADLLEFAKGYKITQFIRDKAPIAASFNIHLRRKGDYASRDCDNEVLAGIQDVATALNAGKIKINECCINVIREFELYSWKKDSAEDEPIKENDDALDCVRYFVHTMRIIQPPWQGLI